MKLKKKFTATVLACLTAATACVSLSANADYPDPNGDGVIDVSDTVYIQCYLSGMFDVDNLIPLDFDGNGIVSQMDARKIQLYNVNLWG